MINSKIRAFFYFLLFLLTSYSLSSLRVKAENNDNFCLNADLEASFELDTSWIYICQQNQAKFLRQVDKNNDQEIINIPASGTFPTYAALAGDLADPNSKIYNVSPYDFKIIQASIIQIIEPVINTIHASTGVKVQILSGAKEQMAIAICADQKPVQVFETKTDNIYICISAPENNENVIDLTYIQQSKSNLQQSISLSAELISSFSYQANNQNLVYLISYQGLEIYENKNKIAFQPVINLYLVASNNQNQQ